MTELYTKTVCVIDNGLFTAFARKIAPAFKKCYYYVPWQRAFSSVRQLSVGRGFPEIERIREVQRIEDQVDLWVFFDVFHADHQYRLVKDGRRVWGARDAENLEHDRWAFQQWLKSVGLPILPTERAIGLDELEKLLGSKTDVYVKASYKWGGRADMETWLFQSMAVNRTRLDELRYDLGPTAEEFGFVVQAKLDKAVEIGYDGPEVDGQWPNLAMQAFEIKGLGAAGTIKPYAQLAAPVRLVNEKLAPYLKAKSSRAGISTEIRWDGRLARFIDPCMRLGSPSNELLQELIDGWPEFLWNGSEGIVTPLRMVKQFGFVAMAYSEISGKEFESMVYPKAIDQWVKLRNPYRTPAASWAVPQGQPQNVAGIVGIGNTLLDAAAQCAEHSKQLKGDRISVDLGSIDKAVDVIAEAQKYGIKFSDQVPTAEQLRKAVAG